MKKNQKRIRVIDGVFILLIVLFISSCSLFTSDDSKEGSKKGLKVESSEVIIAKKNCEITNLEAQLATSDSSLARDERRIDFLIKNCNGRSYSGSGNSRPSNGGGKKTSINTNGGGSSSAPTGNGGYKSSQSTLPQPDASYKTVTKIEPKARVTIQQGEVKWCVQVGPLFYPHVAVLNGEKFDELVDNLIGGYDLFILPSGTVGSTGKNYGIAADGTYWVTEAELAPYLPQGVIPKFINYDGVFVEATKINVNGISYWSIAAK